MSMRIDRTNQTNSTPQNAIVSGTNGSEFSRTIEQSQKLQRLKLQEFLENLEAQGNKLSQSLSLRDLMDFRDMVKSFLRSTFGQSRKIEEDSFWDYSGRPKVMARITQIDKALEELGNKVLDKQSKSLDILAKIDEIRGLIVDLFA